MLTGSPVLLFILRLHFSANASLVPNKLFMVVTQFLLGVQWLSQLSRSKEWMHWDVPSSAIKRLKFCYVESNEILCSFLTLTLATTKKFTLFKCFDIKQVLVSVLKCPAVVQMIARIQKLLPLHSSPPYHVCCCTGVAKACIQAGWHNIREGMLFDMAVIFC